VILDPVSLLVGLALSVVANIATPWIWRQITTTADKRTASNAARAAKRTAQAKYFYEHPEVFTQYLTRELYTVTGSALAVILLAVWIILGLTALGTLRFGTELSPTQVSFGLLGLLVTGVLVAVVSPMITLRLLEVRDFYRRVRRLRVEAGAWPEEWRL
jgi:hypothetical protein